MPTNIISHTMTQRLKCIIYDYEQSQQLNESTQDHLDTTTYFLTKIIMPWGVDLNESCFTQYKHDLLIALHYHEEHINSYPKRTYTLLHKALNAMHVGFNAN